MCLKLPTSCYVDDFVTFTTPGLAGNSQSVLCLMLDILGWGFDREGPKSDDFSDRVAALGVVFLLDKSLQGILVVTNTDRRIREGVEFLERILQQRKLHKKDALVLRGRLSFCDAFIFGRLGKIALQNITKHAYAKPFSLEIDRCGFGTLLDYAEDEAFERQTEIFDMKSARQCTNLRQSQHSRYIQRPQE